LIPITLNADPTALSNAELLVQLQAGDDASFEALFLRHYERIYTVLFRLLGNREDAEDITQQVFLKLYHSPERVRLQDDRLNLAGWLYRVALNEAYNTLRSQKRPPGLVWKIGLAMINMVIDSVIGAGDLFQETVVIQNQGAGISLNGWKLEGSPVVNFSFPDIFLFSGGSLRIHTAAGQNTPSDLYLNQGEAVWPPGTTIILKDATGAEISRFTVSISLTK
jgi:hypothetical protein